MLTQVTQHTTVVYTSPLHLMRILGLSEGILAPSVCADEVGFARHGQLCPGLDGLRHGEGRMQGGDRQVDH